MKQICDLIGNYFCERYNINADQSYNIEYIKATELLVPERFDLIAKICYVRAYITGIGLDWASEVYRQHIMAFSCGREPGNKEKKNVDIYVEVFNRLINDIRENGFDSNKSVIPVGADNTIMDGAHRVAIAIYLKREIPIVRFLQLKANNGYDFFENALLGRTYMDNMALEYIKLCPQLHCACVWPKAYDIDKIQKMEKLMQTNGKIVYKKQIILEYQGIRNLMIQVYSGFEWMGGIDSHFSGAIGKADACYVQGKPMYIYVIEMDSLQHTLDLKAEIRDIFKVGNHSIHISDTQEEAIQIGQMLLSDESIHFLNHGQPDKDIDFFKKIMAFRNEHEENIENFILINDVVLAMYGLKHAETIQYVSDGKYVTGENEKTVGVKELNTPKNYFYYAGLKFATIESLKKYKLIAKEDAKLTETVLQPQSILSSYLKKSGMEVQRKYRNLRHFVRDWLNERNLITIPMKIYHLLSRRK